ncbi:MAG: ABC transporter permease subunit [Candidatus Eisenbacteria bacterium]|uniref:ABC transporter permease subunit n=1 Tax=Eiseniibacteriota bacterium TaxID=2212470 RepID=A0A9D6L5K9_UNCEI|nr:ABC transporter permease subunit [Candidatus Eisenbacteria bacterium]MBI3539041.1 ABC transporter permease subunit [Candidatus Eisenbacteria bacterium]
MRRLIVIAHLTLHEALRRRVLLAALIGGAAFLALYAIGFHFIVRDLAHQTRITLLERRVALNGITLAGLFAVNLLTVMSAVLLPLDTLSGEIASGSIQTLAAKPMRRAEIVLGKWLAHVAVVLGYLAVMAGGVLLVARFTADFVPPAIADGLPLMAIEAVLLVSISIAGGTRLSTVTNGMAAFGLYGIAFVGNWVEQIGTFVNNAAARNVGTVASLIMPAEALWQRAAWFMQPAIMRDLHATPFSPVSVASPAMVWWAAGYAIVAVLLAVRGFQRRQL